MSLLPKVWEGAEGPQNKIKPNKQTLQQPIAGIHLPSKLRAIAPIETVSSFQHHTCEKLGEEEELEEEELEEEEGRQAGRGGRKKGGSNHRAEAVKRKI